jgi:altronate dehydratase
LEDISEECGDIISYKKNTKSLFEQLVLKLEENNDQIYSLHHRVKYLEQECESKDLQIDKMTIAMQEEVDNCHHETEEELERMTRKVNEEITQRQDVEKIVLRLQIENSQLKVCTTTIPALTLLLLTLSLSLSLSVSLSEGNFESSNPPWLG